jgi:hypothetical protein
MALSKELKASLAALVGKTVEEFETALTTEEEVSFEVPKYHTQKDLDTYGTNRFNEGKTAASEIMVKDLRAAHPEIDYSGKKIDEFLKKYKDKVLVDADLKPDDRVVKLNKDLELLQKKYETDLGVKEQEIGNLKKHTFKLNTSHKVLALIPEKTVIPREDIVDLFNLRHEVREEEGKIVVYKDGQVLKNELQSPLELKNVVGTFLDSNKYVAKGGLGGVDDPGRVGADGKFKSMSQFMKHAETKGINPNSEEGIKLLNENKAEGFDYNK